MATFGPELRQMCGLGVYRGLIGNIDKKSPPKCSTETRPKPTSGTRTRSRSAAP